MPSLRSHNKGNKSKPSSKRASKPNTAKRTTRSKRKTPNNEEQSKKEIDTPVSTLGAETASTGTKSPSVLVQADQLPLPPTRTSGTPSPHQVISDCIDATSHEILMVEDLSFEAYSVLFQRLDYYMELMDYGSGDDNDDEELVLKDAHVRNRLFMVKMVIYLCSRSAYPLEDRSNASLIEFSAEDWKNIRDQMISLREVFGQILKEALNKNTSRLANIYTLCYSIIRRMEALEARAYLKSELNSFLKQLEKNNVDVSIEHPQSCITEYSRVARELRGELQAILPTSVDDFFLKDLPKLDGKSINAVKKILTSFTKTLDTKVLSLQQLQTDFARLTRECNSFLPPPTFFTVGYFKDANESVEKSSIQAQEEDVRKPAAKPVSFSVKAASPAIAPKGGKVIHESTDTENKKVRVTRPSVAKAENKRKREELAAIDENASSVPSTCGTNPIKVERASPTKDVGRSNLSYESSTESKVSEISVKRKQKKRVRYTDEEKEALLKGVTLFGVGKWGDIREHYDEVFSKNNRTNVNLKDLYRTLTKVRETENFGVN